MKGYFGKDVTCIYLDQFAASNLFDNPSNELWSGGFGNSSQVILKPACLVLL
ncbi:hypothetical protein [Pedobacter frigoris]|uniref:hypothetical protein n=1 Tax=Pedobacter frigoris TaxID=2571272 RepID=UPI00292D21E8|nr:hypothetical protein [Pedobacter frigoris]